MTDHDKAAAVDEATDDATAEADEVTAAADETTDGLLSARSRRQFLRTGVAAGLGVVAASGASPAAAAPPDVDPENFHVYLAFGQSNMEGSGEIEPQDRETNDRVHLLQDQTCPNLDREYGEWYVAEPPLNRCSGGLGPSDYFGKTMAQELPEEIEIGLVPAAVSATDIALYQKHAPIGDGGYDIPDQFEGGYQWLLDLAQQAQEVGTIQGIIFHQGETNTGEQTWTGQVQGIVENLRSDLGIGEVPFLAGEMLYEEQGGCCALHNAEVRELPEVISNAHVVSAEGLEGQDNAHFTSEAYREFGRRYAEEMLQHVEVDVGGPCEEFDTATVDGQTVCDVDGDGSYMDVTGDGSVTNSDVTEFFANQHAPAWDERTDLFDFDGDENVGQSDVVELFASL